MSTPDEPDFGKFREEFELPSRRPGDESPQDIWQPAAFSAPSGADARRHVEQFLAERDVGRALRLWLGSLDGWTLEQAARRLSRDIARIDDLITRQVNAILHAPAFQKLEATWRGLQHLVQVAELAEDGRIVVCAVDARWSELEQDLDNAVEFDQSEWFRLVYTDCFGTPGGAPLGLIAADYDVHLRMSEEHPHDDVEILRQLGSVAAAAFCPLVLNAHPSVLEMDDFGELERLSDLSSMFERPRYLKWNTLRRSPDARFVSLTMPRVLMRLPYQDDGLRLDGFQFREDAHRREQHLWGGSAFAFAGVVMRSFAQHGWFASVRGVQAGVADRGLVTGLVVPSFATDAAGVALKCCTEVRVTDERERELAELGLTPLVDCPDTEWSAFYSAPSLQQPQKYSTAEATANARISALTPYMLCVSRFAHFLKVMVRDKIGGISEAEKLEGVLNDWLTRYKTSDASPSAETKAHYPLRDAKVQVRHKIDKEGKESPGAFECVIHLQPHGERDEISAMVRLVTEMTPLGSRK